MIKIGKGELDQIFPFILKNYINSTIIFFFFTRARISSLCPLPFFSHFIGYLTAEEKDGSSLDIK